MKLGRAGCVSCAVVFVVASCSSASHPSASTSTLRLPPPITHVTASNLRAAGVAWFDAFLSGSPADIRAMQGPECAPDTSTTYSERFLANYLRAERVMWAHELGMPLTTIRVRRVLVRNVAPTGGETEVVSNVPASKAGNDNWVTFALHDHRLKVADCHAPIGGSSSPSSASPTTAPPHR